MAACVGCFTACATQQTTVALPSCAEHIEVDGVRRAHAREIRIDHTFDGPFAKTDIELTAERRVLRKQLVSSEPDVERVFLGAGFGTIGAVFLGIAGTEMATKGKSFTDDSVLYVGLFGVAALGAGLFAAGTGWHPPERFVSLSAPCTQRSRRR